MGDYIIVYSLVVPSFDAFREIISTVESKGLKPKILQLGKFKPEEKVLTRKQERALLLALKMGFFQVPRRITMRELSDKLEVGLSTLSEIIRRGMRRLLEDHFET
jgi:predicted DNA binding protein